MTTNYERQKALTEVRKIIKERDARMQLLSQALDGPKRRDRDRLWNLIIAGVCAVSILIILLALLWGATQ